MSSRGSGNLVIGGEADSSRGLSRGSSIQLDVVGQLGLLGSDVTSHCSVTLRLLDLQGENLSSQLEHLVLDLAVLEDLSQLPSIIL
jgi:hypothetical protein